MELYYFSQFLSSTYFCTITYEVAIPWTTFLSANPQIGDTFGFNFVYGWSDNGNYIGVEYSEGCCYAKDAELFAKVTLTADGFQIVNPK